MKFQMRTMMFLCILALLTAFAGQECQADPAQPTDSYRKLDSIESISSFNHLSDKDISVMLKIRTSQPRAADSSDDVKPALPTQPVAGPDDDK